MTVARASIANAYTTLMTLVCIALNATEGRFRRLWRSAKLWIVVVHALRALLKKAQAVGRLLCRSVESAIAGTGRTAAAEGKRSVGQLSGGTGDNKTLFVANGLLDLAEGSVAVAGRLWIAVLKAKTVFGEPILCTDTTEFTRPMAEDLVVVAGAALHILQALAVEAGLRSSASIVAATRRSKPARVAGTDRIGPRSLTRTVPRAHLSGSVGRTTDITGLAKEERVSGRIFVALANAIVITDTVC